MSKLNKSFGAVALQTVVVCVLGLAGYGSLAVAAPADKPWADLGRAATADEIKAWDIDVRADFVGLPPGSGSVATGVEIWEAKCESCHGPFAESSQVFSPLVGGITDEDIKSGRVANLNSGTYPHRTTLMKLSKISTLWDYINRAMPWNAPKSLTPDEVYAVSAYILHLGGVVNEDFVFSDRNIAQVQEMLPNRNGMQKFEPMWNVTGKPDVQGDACMKNCAVETERSSLPDYARDAHGNLSEQSRIIGATRGAVTTQPKTKSLAETRRLAQAIKVPGTAANSPAAAPGDTAKAAEPSDVDMQALAQSANCMACHSIEKKIVGPGFKEVAKRYAGEDGGLEVLAGRIRAGASGTWGAVPMPPNASVSEADAKRLAGWILQLPH